MPKLYPTPLSEADVASVAAYIMTLRKRGITMSRGQPLPLENADRSAFAEASASSLKPTHRNSGS
jgi:hypothetical protein